MKRWTVAIHALTFAGCAGGEEVTGGPGDGGSEGADAGAPTAMLDVTGPDRRTLVFEEREKFRVQYTEADGTPIADARVQFALEGHAHDSTLIELEGTTGPEGGAEGTVVAGTTSSAFRVRITAPRAAPAFVEISVSDRGFGTLRTRLDEYHGNRLPSDVLFGVYTDAACEDDVVASGGPDRRKMVAFDEGETDFPALPAGVPYAVTAEGLNEEGTTLARGCTDGVRVERDEESLASVGLDDEPLQLARNYDTDVDVESEAATATVRGTARDAGLGAIESAGGQAPWLLDAVEQHLRDIGDDATAQQLAETREAGEIETELEALLETEEVGPQMGLLDLIDALTGRLSHVSMSGPLTVDLDAEPPFSWSLQQVAAGRDEMSRIVMVRDIFSTPVGAAVRAEIRESRDELMLESLRIRLPLGSLATRTLEGMAEARSLDDAPELMTESSGCEVFAAWADDQPVLADRCETSCARTACTEATARLYERIRESLHALNDTRTQLELSGTARLSEETADLVADRISAPLLEGVWTGEASSVDDRAKGQWRATRPEVGP